MVYDSTLDNYFTNSAGTPYTFHCNTKDIINNGGITSDQKINAFNEIYKVYYDKVIKNGQGETLYDNNSIHGKHCAQSSGYNSELSNYCPQNTTSGTITGANQNNFYRGPHTNSDVMRYKDLKPYLKDCAENLPNLNRISTTNTNDYYKKNDEYQKLPTEYASVVNTRKDLDRKMQEILATKGSIVNEQQNYIDGSVYTTLLWTVLATSLVFYTFTKI